ncbi:MAG: carboxypeptidase-like regulatory domain-containing protein [Bacteroidota bacterium]
MKKNIFCLTIPLFMLLSYYEYIRLSRIVVQGNVLTEDSLKPVAGAFVYTVSGEEEAVTDKNGNFKLTTWESLPVSVTVEHQNFETLNVKATTFPVNQSIRLRRK